MKEKRRKLPGKRKDKMKINIREALRYLGAEDENGEIARRTEEKARELEYRMQPRYIFRVFPLVWQSEGALLPEAGVVLTGKLAQSMLAECDQAALLCCTLGAEFDRMLRAAQARDMADAVILDACGSAYAEAGCCEAEKEIGALHPGLYLTDRFSPGYGDLPLSTQPALLEALNARRLLGVWAGETFLMNPVKTVTAVIGLSARPQRARIRGCAFCAFRDNCAYRKRGTVCD